MAPSDDPADRGNLRRASGAVLLLAGLGLAGCLVAPGLGLRHWALDLLTHFHVQYAVLAIAGLMACGLARHRRLAFGYGILVCFAGFRVLPLLHHDGGAAVDGAPITRVVAVNALTSNRDFARVERWIEDVSPDVAVILELDDAWMEHLEGGLDGYRRVPTDTARGDNFGMGVFVREGLGFGSPTVHVTDLGLPWIEVLVEAPSGPLRVFGVHTVPPMGESSSAARDRQLVEAVGRAADSAEPAIIAGDLNATIWSRGLRNALLYVDMRPACLGQGLGGTWPSRLWFTGGILIDHVLVDPRLAVTGHRVGPDVGSDHRGVVVELAPATR